MGEGKNLAGGGSTPPAPPSTRTLPPTNNVKSENKGLNGKQVSK